MLPLQAAIEHMDEQLVSLLLVRGADPNQPDPECGGFRPLHLSVDIECEDSCRRFDVGEKEAQPHTRLTSLLLQARANPDLPDSSEQTARSIAQVRLHENALILFAFKA